MAWIGFGALASGLVLQRLLGAEVPPHRVQEIKTDYLSTLQIIQRNESLIIYAPLMETDKKNVYEIVLSRPCSETLSTAYSLYRAPTLAEAEEKFDALRYTVPLFVTIVKDMYNINGLQKLCDTMIQNPSWSLGHLVAYFNLPEHIMNPQILKFIDYPDHELNLSPLQLAAKTGNLEVAKLMLPLCKMEHLDNNSNSVFHYAAPTSKEMINLLSGKSTSNLNHCNTDGYTPLHFACLSDKPDCVKALLLVGANVNLSAQNFNKSTSQTSSVADFVLNNPNKLFVQDMKYGGTPLHWSSSREVVETLIERQCDVNALNFDGKTALHVMVARNRLECVVALLAHNADIDLCDKDGNTALHIAVEKRFVPIVQALVVFGCDINITNRIGFTSRHMVGVDANGDAGDMILYILHSVGAKRCPEKNTKCPPGCNAKDSYSGIPPVAPEVPESREHIQQMLASTSRQSFSNVLTSLATPPPQPKPKAVDLIDLTAEQKGQTFMDSLLAMFSTKPGKVSPSTSQPNLSPAVTPTVTEKTESEVKSAPSAYGRGRLLCLDGGGIRGLVLVQMLLEIEKIAQTPISHLFDWVAGTSTGGILALGLGCGKTMKQCMCLYLRMKEQAFVGTRPYASEHLENVLKENLGVYSVMTDIENPKIMVTGVMADRKPVNLHLFRNYTCASEILNIVTPASNRRVPPPPPHKQLIWQAARATGAAPSYFRAFGRFLDGGLIANNPTLDAMTEIHEYNMALRSVGREKEAIPLSVVVSLGTGLIPVTELKEIDVFRPDSLWDTAKLAYGISAIGNLLVDQATASDGRVVDRARAWCSTVAVPYYRFNPQLSEDISMDEKSDQKLMNMLWEAKAYIYANRSKIVEMINLLK